MNQTCTVCGTAFEITDTDLALLDKCSPEIGGQKYPLPPPTMCFNCRLQRRLAFYNCRSLYKRQCDFSQKPIVSIFSPDKPFKVYEKDVWYSDQWDPLEYGREFDFNRPFFEQFHELMQAVPQQSLTILGQHVNSDFTNDNIAVKNCYLVFDGEQAENCLYGHTFAKTISCFDFLAAFDSELCFECVHCQTCYNLKYSRYCDNCNDSWFLRDCIGCSNCFGCANLRQKQYCIFNEQKTKEEYEAMLAQFTSSSHSAVQQARQKVEQFFLTQPVKALRGEQNVNAIGDNLYESKDSQHCFDCRKLQDCRYCTNLAMGAKDCMDVHIWGDGQDLCYNTALTGARSRNIIAGYYVLDGVDSVWYSSYCSRSSKNLFGCVGLKHKEYCVFNKEYKQADYEVLVGKIITHMQQTGEWGEYYPPQLSAFGYNETMAQVFFPLTKEQVQAKSWQWSDYEATVEAKRTVQASQLPDDASGVPDDVLNWAILCEVTGKPFKLVEKELEFYREQRLPLPRRHPDQRHADRFAYKNPYRLYQRKCAKTGVDVWTTYAPDRPEIIYSEEAYKAEVYGE